MIGPGLGRRIRRVRLVGRGFVEASGRPQCTEHFVGRHLQEAEGRAAHRRQLLDMGTRRLQQHRGADQIGLDERRWPAQRTVDMAFRRQMDDGIRLLAREQRLQGRAIADVGNLQLETRMVEQRRDRGAQAGVAELVDADQPPAGIGQPLPQQGRADEAGAAGDQYRGHLARLRSHRFRPAALLNSDHLNDSIHARPSGRCRSWIRCFTPKPILERLMEHDPEEISLRELFDAVWARRLLIIALTLAFGIAAAVVSLLLPEKYEASVVLSPVDDDGSGKLGGAGALLSQFGGLASLGGLSLGGGGSKSVAIATLQSHALTEDFIRENDLLPTLYEDDWDAANKRWTITDPEKIPTQWKAERDFAKKVRSVNEDKKTGLVTLTIEWTDPEIAAKWATELVDRTNRRLRAKAIAESQTNLAYLNEQLTKTSVLELQKSIYGLIEAEIKKVMLANGSEEYAFKVIDPARVAEEKVSPKRMLMTAVGLFAGMMLGFLLALSLPRRTV